MKYLKFITKITMVNGIEIALKKMVYMIQLIFLHLVSFSILKLSIILILIKIIGQISFLVWVEVLIKLEFI